MPSDKHNLTMTIATGLISLLINVTLSRDVPLCQPQQLLMVYQSLTLFSFVLHFLLPYHVGDDLWVCALWLQCETCVSAELAGGFFILCLDYYPKGSQSVRSSWKQSIVIQQCNQVTHLLLN